MRRGLIWFAVVLVLGVIGAWMWFSVLGEDRDSLPRVSARPTQSPAITWLDANTYAEQEIDELLTAWAKQNSLVVRAEHIASGYDATLKTRINKGEIPDVWVNRAGLDNQAFSEYGFDWTNEEILKELDATSLEQCTAEGRVVGLPWSREAYGIVYNRRMLKNAGIETEPRTLSELEAVCQALEARGIVPFANGYKEAWVLSCVASQFSSEAKFAGASELFRYLDMTLRYGQDRPLETDWRACAYSIAKGQAAMSYLGDWCESAIKKINPYVDIGFLPLPVSEDAEDARLIWAISWVLKLNKNSPHFVEAKALVEHVVKSGVASGGGSGALGADAIRALGEGRVSGWGQETWPSGFETKCARTLQDYLAGNLNADETIQVLEESRSDLTKSLSNSDG